MKRILLLISVVLAFNGTFAQQVGTSKSINFKTLEKEVAKSNASIENPKKNAKDATWISRAELMIKVYNSQILNAYIDMTTENFNLVVGKPNEQTNVDIDEVSTDKYIMDRVTFFFIEGKLSYWQVTNPIVENSLDLARISLQKAIELDVNSKKTKKISDNLAILKRLYVNDGLNSYSNKDFANAYKSFKSSIELAIMPQVNALDTEVYYYAGLAAQLANNLEGAIEMYQKSIEYDKTMDGASYYNIYEANKKIGKEDEGTKYLEEGLVKFPQNLNILYSLINYYINKGEDPSKIITYIDKALGDDPQNASLHFAKGTLCDKIEKTDEAVAAYEAAIKINPEYFDAYYNLGAVYYNLGVKYIEEAAKIPASKEKEYDEVIAKSAVEFKKSIPYMVKAAEINPESKEAVETVMNLYFRYRNESEEMMNLYNKYKEMLDNLKK